MNPQFVHNNYLFCLKSFKIVNLSITRTLFHHTRRFPSVSKVYCLTNCIRCILALKFPIFSIKILIPTFFKQLIPSLQTTHTKNFN
jgi:hypothetical protein